MWIRKHERDRRKGVDSPMPTQVVSTEEFIPRPQSEQQKKVERLIVARGLTQAEAAKVLHVTQPRISDLTRGKIDRFSIDTLVEMLSRAGADVTFKVRRRTSAA